MRKGFTLIELLVVIAIISILAGILFPVFAKAREKARQAACLSNVKQIQLAYLSYAEEWSQCGPPKAWCAALLPYHRDQELYFCPSGTPYADPCPAGYHHTYQINGSRWVVQGAGRAPKITACETPAQLITFCDGEDASVNHELDHGDNVPSGDIDPAQPDIARRHNDGFNAAFMDGHAKWCNSIESTYGDGTCNGTNGGPPSMWGPRDFEED